MSGTSLISLVSPDPQLSEWKAGQDGVSQPGLTTRATIENEIPGLHLLETLIHMEMGRVAESQKVICAIPTGLPFSPFAQAS